MKKLMALVLCLCMVMTCFVGCGSDPAADEGGGADETYTLTIGHVYAVESIEQAQMEKLKELAAEYSDGRLEVKIFPSEQLGPEKDLCEQVVMGTCDAAFSEGSLWATVTDKPELGVFGLPFQYSSIEAMNYSITEMIRPELGKIAEDTAILPIATVGSGFRHVFTIDNPITCLEDFAGLKVRIPAVTLYVQIFEALGANPTTTAFSEAYQSLQQRVVDACEIDIPNCVQQNWQEVVNYMTYTYHLAALNVICINREKYNSYPEDIQEALMRACEESEEYSFELRANADAEYIETIKAAGVEINELDPAELARMREACQPLYDEFIGYGMGDLLDEIAAVNERF